MEDYNLIKLDRYLGNDRTTKEWLISQGIIPSTSVYHSCGNLMYFGGSAWKFSQFR